MTPRPFSRELRKKVKAEARQKVNVRFASCLGMYYAKTLIEVFVFATFGWALLAITFWYSYFWAENGYLAAASSNIYENMAVQFLMAWVGAFLFFMLVFFWMGAPLAFGSTKFYIALSNDIPASVDLLWSPFMRGRQFWNSIKLSVCMMFRTFLWMLIPQGIWEILLFGTQFGTLVMENRLGFPVLLCIQLLFAIIRLFVSTKSLSYSGCWAIIDREEYQSVWAATVRSARIFKGCYWSLMLFSLSFLPWQLLMVALACASFLLGVMLIFLMNSIIGVVLGVLIIGLAIAGLSVLLCWYLSYVNVAFFSLFRDLENRARAHEAFASEEGNITIAEKL